MADSKNRSKEEPAKRAQKAAWVRGTYTLGLEVSCFQPEGSQERWWTSFPSKRAAATAELQAAARRGPTAVELLGVASEAGAYGHMGLYQREFIVEQIRGRVETAKERKR